MRGITSQYEHANRSVRQCRFANQSYEIESKSRILADDFGYGSTNAYGADPKLVRTPHLDRLAKEGRRFTDANTTSSVCSPTRYALMTGRYAWRTSLKFGVLNVNAPLHIETTRPNLAALFKKHGYQTAAVGKWHLGYGVGKPDYTGELKPGPLELGFDYHFGVPSNHGDVTGVFVENHRVFGLRSAQAKPLERTNFANNRFLGLDAPLEATIMTRRSFNFAMITALAGLPARAAALTTQSLPPVRRITHGPKFHWFGYYDKWQFDPTGRFVLGCCDNHQRYSPDGAKVVIDSTHEGLGRQMYLIDVSNIIAR